MSGRVFGETAPGADTQEILVRQGNGCGPPGNAVADTEAGSPRLTRRQQTVMRLLVEGKRNQEISDALQISERTVKFHVSGLFAKLGVSSRTQVVSHALRRGLI